MDIYVLDSEYNKIGVIDYCESIIWTTRYCDSGDFELYLPVTSDAINLLKIGCGLVRDDKPESVMIISTIQISTDEENGNHIAVSGKYAEGLLERRIVWNQTNLSGTLTACVKQLVLENLIDPSDTNRKIDRIQFGDCCDCEIYLTKQITGDNLLDSVKEILSAYNFGFKLIFDGKIFSFCIYRGSDKSFAQSANPHVIFSPKYDNLLTSEYNADISNYKNVALVAGEGEGVQRKYYAVGQASGVNRLEIYVDARDISSETDSGTLSLDQYNQLLASKGVEALSEALTTQSFAGTVEPTINYTFGIDYNLGDIVQITNEYGISSPARIVEVIESWDENGYSCIPTFDSKEV